jgi:hypothetical protein
MRTITSSILDASALFKAARLLLTDAASITFALVCSHLLIIINQSDGKRLRALLHVPVLVYHPIPQESSGHHPHLLAA